MFAHSQCMSKKDAIDHLIQTCATLPSPTAKRKNRATDLSSDQLFYLAQELRRINGDGEDSVSVIWVSNYKARVVRDERETLKVITGESIDQVYLGVLHTLSLIPDNCMDTFSNSTEVLF